MKKAEQTIRCVCMGIIILLISGSFAAAEAGVFEKMCSWLDDKTSWGDNEKVQKAGDILATDGVSDGMDYLGQEMNRNISEPARRSAVESGRKIFDNEIKKLEQQKNSVVKKINDLKQSNQSTYRTAKDANPSLKAYDHYKKVDSQTNHGLKVRTLKTELKDIQKTIDNTASAKSSVGKNAGGADKISAQSGGGFFQKLGKLMTSIDISGATGRVAAEFYEAYEGNSTYRSAFGRMAEEAGRIKFVGFAAATGAAAGVTAGPGAFVASPVLAVSLGAGASKMYAETIGASGEKSREYLADVISREKYAFDQQKLAAKRAEIAARKAQERLDKKLALQARAADYDASMKYLADLRKRVAAFNEQSRLEDEARRKKNEQYELDQAKKTKTVSTASAAPAPRVQAVKPVPVKSGAISRTFSAGAYEMTVQITGASLIKEIPPKKRLGSLNAGEIRVAATSSQCAIHVSYKIKQVLGARAEEITSAASTYVKADFLELNENWANLRPVQQKYASSQVHKGNGPHSGEFSIAVEANHMIKKYMLSTYSSFLTSDIYLSVLVVSSGNRHLLEK